MEIEEKIQILINNTNNIHNSFELMCYFEFLYQNNKGDIFIDLDKNSLNKRLNNKYSVELTAKLFSNNNFISKIESIMDYYIKYKELDNIPDVILNDGHFIRLNIELSFYSMVSEYEILTFKNIDYVGLSFLKQIKNLEKNLNYKYNMVDILSVLIDIIFDVKFSYKENPYPYKLD
jgi:hypothetical protein